MKLFGLFRSRLTKGFFYLLVHSLCKIMNIFLFFFNRKIIIHNTDIKCQESSGEWKQMWQTVHKYTQKTKDVVDDTNNNEIETNFFFHKISWIISSQRFFVHFYNLFTWKKEKWDFTGGFVSVFHFLLKTVEFIDNE